ncbi:hypothetical protein K1719_020046 [Acacia pycnantha]|nr:hypothetical protein K1719_020046 [Acacia pycnantha]
MTKSITSKEKLEPINMFVVSAANDQSSFTINATEWCLQQMLKCRHELVWKLLECSQSPSPRFTFEVTCKVINVRSGAELPEKWRELALHFETKGTPVMIGK